MYAGEKIASYATRAILNLIKAGYCTARMIKEEGLSDYNELSPQEIHDRLSYLKRRGRLLQNPDGSYILTKNGQEYLDKLEFRRVHQTEWDGLWRVVTYDIPEHKRAMRDSVRNLVKGLGMRQLQKSVWVIPYECKKQFRELETAYGQKGAILYLETPDIEGAQEFISYWNLHRSLEFTHDRE